MLSEIQVMLLQPVVALVLWTLVIMVWFVSIRLPAMAQAGVKPDDAAHAKNLSGLLPSKVTRVSDNYSHLNEQPTLFYAVTIAIALMGNADMTQVNLAWAYVVLRVIHSLVQCTYNKVMHRFFLFLLGSLSLVAMTLIEVSNWL